MIMRIGLGSITIYSLFGRSEAVRIELKQIIAPYCGLLGSALFHNQVLHGLSLDEFSLYIFPIIRKGFVWLGCVGLGFDRHFINLLTFPIQVLYPPQIRIPATNILHIELISLPVNFLHTANKHFWEESQKVFPPESAKEEE